jgi:hypothetical protein
MLLAACAVMAGTLADAQPRTRGRAAPGQERDGRVSPAEIQRLFDAYVVMQAQETLRISDEQYPRFLARVKALQDVRRDGDMARARLVSVLRRLTQADPFDDAQARETLRQLAALDARVADDTRNALAAVDEVLDVQQQARFRVFEQQMERRKLELLLRARQDSRRRGSNR